MLTSTHQVHIFGAGIAGLATAVYCLKKGLKIKLYEAANHAGGRCRSFHDSVIDRVIDNGNHLILGGNWNIFDYLNTIGAATKLQPAANAFSFIDLKNGERWTIRPGNAKFPLWIFLPHRRIPGTRLKDYTALRRLPKACPSATLTNCVDTESTMFKRFWEPLCNAVLNTDATEGSAKLMGRMLEHTLLRGPAFVRPFLAPEGLSATLVNPAVDYLLQRGSDIKFGKRLKSISLSETRVESLVVGDADITCGETDHIVLALPPYEVAALIPELIIPTETRPIINIHFKLDPVTRLPDDAPFIGIINGTSHWVFRRDDLLSVTVSSATELVSQNTNTLVEKIWREISTVIEKKDMPIPPYRILKEHRATIAQTPTQDALRPDSATKWVNMHLAGDWTNTGLPATIESAIQSGQNAAEILEISLKFANGSNNRREISQ